MKLFEYAGLLFCVTLFSGCSIYKSPDRKDFESIVTGLHIQNLKSLACSDRSIKDMASDPVLISTETSALTDESEFLWQYKVNNQVIYESDNLKGVYCLYENI